MSEVLVKTKTLDLLTNVISDWLSPFVTNVLSLTMSLYGTAFVYHIFGGQELSGLLLTIIQAVILMVWCRSIGR